MTTRLILPVLGEPDATRRVAFADDEGLNARGRDAADEWWRAPRGRDEVLTSPAQTARQTAAASGMDGLAGDAVIEDALRDIDVGAWRGRTLADITAADPVAAADWIVDPGFDAHGGE